MDTATDHGTRTQAFLAKFPAGDFGYRHPRFAGTVEILVGVWLIILGAIACAKGFWWGASLIVVSALPLWIGQDFLKSGARS
jgi:hypothetical protein